MIYQIFHYGLGFTLCMLKKIKTMIQIKDCKCNKCRKQAVAFWPACDPDIHQYPWCRVCLDEAKQKLMIEIFKIN